jgi:hypothetical protein
MHLYQRIMVLTCGRAIIKWQKDNCVIDIQGNELATSNLNMAENITEVGTENRPKRRGRDLAIDDARLWGVRDHLVWLFETTWADVGGALSTIKVPAEVCVVLRVWEQQNRHNQHYVAQTLLGASSGAATAKQLNEKRRRLGHLNTALREASDWRDKCRGSLELAQRAINPELSVGERAVVEEQIAKRADRLSQAEAEYQAARDRQQKMEQLLKEGESHFARAEFVKFLRSNRYRLTPLNVANALAGLPYIGWRQSAKRCKPHAAPGANGGSMQIFNTIRRIVESCTRKSELIKHAERWLKAQSGTKSYGVTELRKDFYYLRWSIKTVLEAGSVRRRDLPFAIAREYWKRKTTPSNVDLLFAEEEAL